MVALRSLILCAAVFGAVSAKRTKRSCPVKPAPPTMPGSEPSLPPTLPVPEPPTEPVPAPPTMPGSDVPPPPSDPGSQTPLPTSGEYKQSENYQGDAWFNDWEHWGYDDPTHGRVRYLSRDDARSKNLSYVGPDGKKFFMRTDTTTVLDPNGPGRDSVRIQSNKAYTTHTAILDVQHMPSADGAWPAYWTCGENWPQGGEFDIIEYVNKDTNNLSSLHTGDDCTQPDNRDMSGNKGYYDCNANGANGNQGCGVSNPDQRSAGSGFNSANGGYYATERTNEHIKVWFWSRDDANVPADVKNNLGFVSPSTWGKPITLFVNDSCNLGAKFGPNKFIINLTWCGDWAGNAYNGGLGACNDFVNNNPGQLTEAYWEINRMTVYE